MSKQQGTAGKDSPRTSKSGAQPLTACPHTMQHSQKGHNMLGLLRSS